MDVLRGFPLWEHLPLGQLVLFFPAGIY